MVPVVFNSRELECSVCHNREIKLMFPVKTKIASENKDRHKNIPTDLP